MTQTLQTNPPTPSTFSRREFLGLAWIGALGVGLLKLTEMLGRTFLPRRPKGTYGSEFEVGTLAELPAIADAPLAYPEGRFWLVRNETGVLALHRACTHLDCLISWDDASQKFVCPCHGSEFSREGACLQGPASLPLHRFALRVVTPDGELAAETDETGAPLPVDALLEGENAVAAESRVLVDTASKIQAVSGG
jgi:cytochrome b6-f complex iron-sulfur subunit